jgi:hypothetical protein
MIKKISILEIFILGNCISVQHELPSKSNEDEKSLANNYIKCSI